MTHSQRALLAGLSISVLAAMPASAEPTAEVMHWFTAPAEQASIKVYSDQFAADGGTWVDTAIAGGANARTAIISRIVGGQPPTAAQFNALLQFGDLLDGGLMPDIDTVASEDNWAATLPPLLVDTLTYDGKIVAVPMNIQGQNWLWSNLQVLEAAGAARPTTFDELFTALDKVKASGTAVPLAFQSEPVWTRTAFNIVLLGKGGQDLYNRVYVDLDPEAVRTPEFAEVVETYRKLRGYIDEGAASRKWVDANAMVINGQAAFQFMGDWAKGEFTNAGKVIGTDFGCDQMGGMYMMNTNIMTFPKVTDEDQRAAQVLLARAMMKPEAQVAFANFKGSVPPRVDVDKSALDSCTQEALDRIANPETLVLTTELLITPERQGALEDLIVNLWNTPDQPSSDFIERFATTLAQDL